jgi:hypothetical protein
VSQERRDLLDRCSGLAAELGGGVAQHVGRDLAETGCLPIAAQVGVEGRPCDGKRSRIVDIEGPAHGTGCKPDGLPGWFWKFPAAHRPSLGAHFVPGDAVGGRVTEAEAHELAPPQAGENGRDDDRSIEGPGWRLWDRGEQPFNLGRREPARERTAPQRTPHLTGWVGLDHAHAPRKVVEP